MDDREYRIRLKMTELAASVARKDGEFWEAVRGVRERWRIEVRTQIPRPIYPGAYYVPAQLAEEPQRDDAGHEKWLDLLREWNEELSALYKRFIPEDCREPVGPDERNWVKFLSACVLFDPPIADRPDMPGLTENCDVLDDPHESVHLLTRNGTLTPTWVSPLLASVRDARKTDELPYESALPIIAALQNSPDLLLDRSPEEVRDELLRRSPSLAENLQRLPDEIAPRRILLDHEAGDTAKELHAALEELLTSRPQPPKRASGGSKERRDPVLAAEAAILAKRPGWTHARVAEFNGWMRGYDYSLATQWIEDGEEIISKL